MEAKRENSVEGFVTGLSSAKVGLETRGTHAARGTNTWIWSREQGKTILTLGGILFVLASLLAAQPAASLSSSELADGAASIPLFRLRRQSQSQQQAQTRNQLIQQQQRQLAASEQEEELMRNQLPDLIAQAHNDKMAERALLKLIIDASLRNGLANIMASSQQRQQLAAARNNWPLADNSQAQAQPATMDELTGVGELANAGQTPANLDLAHYQGQLARLARLEGGIQSGEPYANLDNGQLVAEFPGQAQQERTVMDKREYIKPCSFNAISCVRTPFRKL